MKFIHIIVSLVAGVAVLGMAACSTVNKSLDGLGLNIQYEDVYAEASTVEERIFLTAGLYEATLDAVLAQCEPAEPDTYLLEACAKASAAATRLTPAVDAMQASLSVYIGARDEVGAAIAENGVASPELLTAAAAALTDLLVEYSEIRDDLRMFIEGPGS